MDEERRIGLDTGGGATVTRGQGARAPSSDSGTKKRGRAAPTHAPPQAPVATARGEALEAMPEARGDVADGRGEAAEGLGDALRGDGERRAD